ncbi:hypothetical protein HJG45_21045 [Roseicella sp. DB1501]|nr:hypothetical protein [Roseicella sp. DB1501]
MSGTFAARVKDAIQSAANRNEISLDEAGLQTMDLKPFQHLGDRFDLNDTPAIVKYLKERATAQKDINAKLAAFAWFGAPTTDLQGDAEGYFQHFQQGSIYWTPSLGAHEVHGDIRAKYFSLGAEKSYLKYPMTDELTTQVAGVEVRYSNFEGGSINWKPGTGAYIDLSISVRVERHQLGAWLHIGGTGFTPGGTVRFSVENLDGMAGPKSTGVFTIAKADGTFTDVVWDGRTWSRGGAAHLRALDEASGRSVTASIPALY